MKVGPLAIKLMHHFEGCKLKAYRCPAGIWTIGWGHTGADVRAGLVWTQEQADAAFRRRIDTEFAPAVERAAGEASPAQFGAMVALAYNIGTGGFARSSVARKHKAGAFGEAEAAFALWNKGGGRVLPGLVRRRAAEAALYRSDFAKLASLTGGEVA